MKRYTPTEIEQKWQDIWEREGTYQVDLSDHSKPKYYGFSMLPGITGAGIHIGHGRTYQFSDIKVRAKRQQGFNAYHPIGWDSFGLPVENYAIKVGKKPREAHDDAKANFVRQLKRLGFSYDWSKEVSTADPEYYKWTQWIFTKLHEQDLAYQKESPQWWCETDQTVLANEQVESGNCWRCGNPVTKKQLKQWFFKITEYADEILEATDDLNWTEMVKTMQKNWIGKSQGAEVEFTIDAAKENYILLHGFRGSSKANFFPAAKKTVEKSGATTYVPDLPNADNPDAKEQAEYVLQNATPDENTVLLGHSYGAVSALRIAEKVKIKKLILVAGFAEPGLLDRERPFEKTTDWQFDFEKIKENVGKIIYLRPKNDTAVPQERTDFLFEKLGGTIVDFVAEDDHACGENEPEIIEHLGAPTITVFTTRPDTLFGAMFIVLAPEHELVPSLVNDDTREAVQAYIEQATRQSDIERMNESRDKTGVFTGSYAINPATGEQIPIWVADYVLSGYGTGAIMAVPAHDERDFEFAERFDLPVKQVVADYTVYEGDAAPRDDWPTREKQVVDAIITDGNGKYLLQLEDVDGQRDVHFVGGGVDEGDESIESSLRREVLEEVGYPNIISVKQVAPLTGVYAQRRLKKRNHRTWGAFYEVVVDPSVQVKSEIDEGIHQIMWVSKDEVEKMITWDSHRAGWKSYVNEKLFDVSIREGILVSSGAFDGMPSSEAREEIVAWLEQQGIGASKTTYKMRDWLISRQRYWGAPIPMVHTKDHGTRALTLDQLPLELPDVDDYKPKGGATSVLATVEDWVHVWFNLDTTETVPFSAGKPDGEQWVEGHRETDTLDGYACSSWYWLRYTDPFNHEQAWSPEGAKYWQPVDFYNGADHAVAHLLYSRFWTRFFYKQGWVPDPEPFKRMMYNGYIMAPGGEKMSKSKGNVIDPMEIMDSGYGADSLRVYEMFIAPYDMDAPWDTRGVPGTYRFLNRTWTLTQEYLEAESVTLDDAAAKEILAIAHKTVKKVTSDIEDDKFNTAVSSMMEAVNTYYKLKEQYGIGASEAWTFAIESLLQVLAPFAPHITEELWHQLGHEATIHKDTWPQWDEQHLVSNTMTIVVQVNGKLRDTIEVSADTEKDAIIAEALELEKVAAQLGDKKPTKVIYVPGRLVNVVV